MAARIGRPGGDPGKTDDSFAKILDGLKTFSSNYGAYLSEEQMKEEFEILEAVLEGDPHNPQVAHRLGKMAMALGDWPKAIDIFSKFVNRGISPSCATWELRFANCMGKIRRARAIVRARVIASRQRAAVP